MKDKSRTRAAWLALLFGVVGAHRYYLGQYKYFVVYLLLSPTLIPMLIGWIDAAQFLVWDDEEFRDHYQRVENKNQKRVASETTRPKNPLQDAPKNVRKFHRRRAHNDEEIVEWCPGNVGELFGSGEDRLKAGHAIVTSKRVVFFSDDLLDQKFKQISLRDVSTVDSRRQTMKHIVRVHATNTQIAFATYDGNQVNSFVRAVERQVEIYNDPNRSARPSSRRKRNQNQDSILVDQPGSSRRAPGKTNHRAFDIELPPGGQKPRRVKRLNVSDSFLDADNDSFHQVELSDDGDMAVGVGLDQVTVALFHLPSKQKMFQKQIGRPHFPKVGNNGVVIVQDWKRKQALSGAAVVLAPNGVELVRKDFNVNILDAGICPQGDRVYAKTAGGECEEHANKVFLYDVVDGRPLFETDWPYDVQFDDRSRLCVRQEGSDGRVRLFPFDQNGEPGPEYEEFQRNQKLREAKHNPGRVISDIRSEVHSDDTDWRYVEQLLDAVEPRMSKLDARGRARVHRYIGQLEKHRGNIAEAVNRWERALQLDENVGVKRRLKKARKQLSGDGQQTKKSDPSPEAEQEADDDGRPMKANGDPLERIERLSDLRDAGAISDEEFEAKKSELLEQV